MTSSEGANSEMRRSFAWRAFAAAGGIVSTFLLSVIVVRELTLRDAAAFFAILAAVSFGPLVGRLGLGQNVIRLMGAECDPRKRRQIAGTHLHATVVLSCLTAPAIALIGCVALIGDSDLVPTFILTSVLIAIESTRLMVSDIFAAAGRVRASMATMHYVRSLLALPLVALMVFTSSRPSLLEVLGAYLAVSGIQFAAACVHARREVAVFEISFGIRDLKTALGQGAHLFILDLSEFMLRQGTIFLAAAAFSPLAATHYSAAAMLALQVTLLDSLCALAVTPPAARLWAAGRRTQVVRMLSNVATLNSLVSVSVVLLLALLGPLILELAYGVEMRSASAVLLILAASGIFQAYFDGSVTLLVISGHIAAAARTAMTVLMVALPAAVAAALAGGPKTLATVACLSVMAKSICQWMTVRKVLSASPRAHHHVIRAFRELVRDRDDDLEDSASATGSSRRRDPRHVPGDSLQVSRTPSTMGGAP
ncbi:teichoic acid transporter [Mycobacterium manitobense]|uniref:Teichoic acid transporter n=1 Tax=[Mycobacterium] manitobense TaxID=190147 RepID=A0A9X2YPW2_9MYCO|nr:teichoic acid transporter [[Mycobacterium] manitobense]MCV7171928.1 teichoic acid transporter [[Mycobacterium] manitobense]